jgi:ribonuclease HI
MSRQNLHFRQLNCHKSLKALQGLEFITRNDRNSIILITEPNLDKGKKARGFKGHRAYSTETARAAILIDGTLKAKIVDKLTGRDCVACVLETDGMDTLVASVYCDINVPNFDLIQEVARYADVNNYRLILGTDSNAHSTLWGRTQNTRGNELELVMAGTDLKIENLPGGLPTFRGNQGEGTHIDLTLTLNANNDCIGWNTTFFPDSDHNLITFKCAIKPEKEKVRAWNKISWGQVRQSINQRAPHIKETVNAAEADRALDSLINAITSSVDEHCPLKDAVRHKQTEIWTNKDLQPHIAHKRKLLVKFRRTRLGRHKDEYKTQSNLVCNKIRDLKYNLRNQELEELKSIPDLMKQIKRQTPQPCLEIILDNAQNTLEALMDRHCPDSIEPDTDPETLPRGRIKLSELDKLYPHINKATIHKAFKQFKPHKTAGPDQIVPIILHNLPEETLDIIVRLYKATIYLKYTPRLWRQSETIFIPKPGKDTYNTVESFRPITLSNYLLKGLERVELWQLERTHFVAKPMTDMQFAFRKGRSTETALSKTIHKIEQALYKGDHCIGVFLDIKGAFDMLDHDAAINAMRRRGISEDFIGWYEHYLRNRTTTSKLAGCSITRVLKRGTPQGGVLSPVVWNIVFEEALKDIAEKAFVTGFADDGCVVVHDKRPEKCRQKAQEAVDAALDWGRRNGLEFNAAKTEAIYFKMGKHRKPTRIKINRVPIPYKQSAKYLGMTLSADLCWSKHIKKVAEKARRTIFAAKNLIRRQYGVRPDMMHWIWTGCIIPKMLYGCHLWADRIKSAQKKILDKVTYAALTNIAHCHKGTPLAGLQIILGTPPLHLKAKELALAAHDRLQLHWNERELQPEHLPPRGHLNNIIARRQRLVGDSTPDYEVKTNPKARVKYSENQATEANKADVEVYTDGSKKDGKVGAAYTITNGMNELTYGQFSLPPESTVFQSELVAIQMAAERLIELKMSGKINIHTDSLSSIQALKADTLLTKQAIRTQDAIRRLAKNRKVKLKIYWVKAHVGTEFNERADELAKNAPNVGIPYSVQPNRRSLKNKYEEETMTRWNAEWKNATERFKRTRYWFPETDWRKTKKLLTKDRPTLSTLIQWITGFSNLMRHRHKKNRVINDICRLCNEDTETPEHLSFHCPAIINHRTQCFRTHIGKTAWTVNQLAKFVNNQTIRDLMKDATQYRTPQQAQPDE